MSQLPTHPKVLSLFNGMGCIWLALDWLGVVPAARYSSEIDRFANEVNQANYPDTVQLGSVIKLRQAICWKPKIFEKMRASKYISAKTKAKMIYMREEFATKSIDLLVGGSPCQGFSFAGKGLNFDDPRSKLFFEFVRVLQELRSINPNIIFLLENVRMKKEHEAVITQTLEVPPVLINSSLVSAQNRERLYWTNINMQPDGMFGEMRPVIPQPADRGIYLRDILEEEVDKKYLISERALQRMFGKTYSLPRVMPEKTGTLSTKNNSGQLGCDAGTTLVGCVNDRGKLRRVEKSTCLDANSFKGIDNHGQRTFVKCSLTLENAGNHSDMDAIYQKPSQVTPTKTENGKTPQWDRVYNVNGKSPVLLAGANGRGPAIFQRPRGKNAGGFHEAKSPALTGNSFEQNHAVGCVKIGRSPEGKAARRLAMAKGKDHTPFQAKQINDLDFEKMNCLTTATQKDNILYHVPAGIFRRLTPVECCRLQTVPDGYFWKDGKQIVSDTQIYKMLGNGWTVEVIAHILKLAIK